MKVKVNKKKLASVLFTLTITLLPRLAFGADYDKLGQNISNFAKSVLQPLGWVVAVVKGAQTFTDEHNRLKHALWAAAGAAVGFWDDTIDFIRGLFGD